MPTAPLVSVLLAVHDGDLIAAGDFTTAGDASADSAARADPAARQRMSLNPNCAAFAAQRGEWKRGCQPAIQTKVGVYAACTLGASDRRRTSVRRRVANRLAWTGLIR